MAWTISRFSMHSCTCTVKPRASSSRSFSAEGTVWSLSMPMARKVCKRRPVRAETWPSRKTPRLAAASMTESIRSSPAATALKSMTSPNPATPGISSRASISAGPTSKPESSRPGAEGMVEGAVSSTRRGRDRQASARPRDALDAKDIGNFMGVGAYRGCAAG